LKRRRLMARFQRAFVLVKVAPGHERAVLEELMEIDEVREAHIVPGEWDILAVVSSKREIVAPSDERVYRVVLDKINKIRHIQDTNTMVSQFSKTK
jgi:DNA-binding Lrp family transcriptional regulator